MGGLSPNWELDYCRRQADINGWLRQRYQPRLVTVEKLLVYHPDEYRRYLRRWPCADCRARPCCDTPCKVYLEWYDRRVQAVKGRYEIGDMRYKISQP